MTERILINEVGLRDALQNQPSILSTDQKLALFHTLRAAGIRDFEATSFVSPKHVPQLADAAEFLRLLPQDRSLRYTCLIPNERGYERALAAGATGIAVVLSATEGLNQKNIGMSLVQATEVCERVVRRAKDEGLFARAYIAAAFACPFEGLTPPRVLFELLDRMRTAGADELAIADTIGAANPRQVKDVFQEAINRYDDSHVAAHFHDTRGLGTALAWTAAEAGVRRFDISIAGLVRLRRARPATSPLKILSSCSTMSALKRGSISTPCWQPSAPPPRCCRRRAAGTSCRGRAAARKRPNDRLYAAVSTRRLKN